MSSALNDAQIKRILQGISIPPQPQVMVDLHIEQAMPDPDMETIANIISRDIGLSAAVLKFVNSAYFGLPKKISSINQAVILLGINTISNIVNGLSVKNELSDSKIELLHSFWDNAMDVADVSVSIAKQIGFRFEDECYALGLFHNAGIPLLMERFNNYNEILNQGYNDPNFKLTDIENKAFKTNHSVVGYYLAKSWALPKSCCYVIAHHHRIERLFTERVAGDATNLTFAAVLKMAEHIANTCKQLGNANTDYEWEKVKYLVLEHLDLSDYDFDGIIEACREQGIGSI